MTMVAETATDGAVGAAGQFPALVRPTLELIPVGSAP
jgi:hypothetical protein